MKTLHIAYRVTDLTRSLAFYSALGYIKAGQVAVDERTLLTMLKFVDDPFVTIELVHSPHEGRVQVGTGFHHLVVQADDLAETIEVLNERGLDPTPIQYPGGPDGPKTSWLTDPDGYPIELVEWPSGHADGFTESDFS